MVLKPQCVSESSIGLVNTGGPTHSAPSVGLGGARKCAFLSSNLVVMTDAAGLGPHFENHCFNVLNKRTCEVFLHHYPISFHFLGILSLIKSSGFINSYRFY